MRPADAPAVRYSADRGIATLVLDHRAKMNAMTFEMWSSIPDLIARADADPEVRVVALRGAGERSFCAGADISQFGSSRAGEEAVAAYDHAVAAANAALAGAHKPTVAVVAGICYGGGFGLAMACDLRIAASGSRFRIPAARLGLGYGYDGIAQLVGKLGMGPVADLLLTARAVECAEARDLGIVNAIIPAERFEEETLAYLLRIAGNAPLTLRVVKRALVELGKPEADRDPAAVEALVAACFASEDYREGQAAFTEKRDPEFRGR